jgi:K+/H+ antiporter YhaU regulatory subunit KhtT
MTTRETELPGVGTKHTLELASGEQLVVVEHRVGHWELARVDGDGTTTPLATLQSREAAELGRVLSRSAGSTEDSRKQMLFEEFSIEWVALDASSQLIGQTLQEAGIRAHTGVSVIAILRPEGSMASPPPDARFRDGDTLVVIGQPDQVETFLRTYSKLAPES